MSWFILQGGAGPDSRYFFTYDTSTSNRTLTRYSVDDIANPVVIAAPFVGANSTSTVRSMTYGNGKWMALVETITNGKYYTFAWLSEDNGSTWKQKQLPDSMQGRTSPYSRAQVLFGQYTGSMNWYVTVNVGTTVRSVDNGDFWFAIDWAVTCTGGKKLLAVDRTQSGDAWLRRLYRTSEDGGTTWSERAALASGYFDINSNPCTYQNAFYYSQWDGSGSNDIHAAYITAPRSDSASAPSGSQNGFGMFDMDVNPQTGIMLSANCDAGLSTATIKRYDFAAPAAWQTKTTLTRNNRAFANRLRYVADFTWILNGVDSTANIKITNDDGNTWRTLTTNKQIFTGKRS